MYLIWNVFPAELFTMMGKNDKAADIYRDLIDRNPENWAYYRGYESAKQLGTKFDNGGFLTA